MKNFILFSIFGLGFLFINNAKAAELSYSGCGFDAPIFCVGNSAFFHSDTGWAPGKIVGIYSDSRYAFKYDSDGHTGIARPAFLVKVANEGEKVCEETKANRLKFCVGDPAFYVPTSGVIVPGTIGGLRGNQFYLFKKSNGKDYIDWVDSEKLAKGAKAGEKVCGKGTPKFCTGEDTFLADGNGGKIVGVFFYEFYVFKYNSDGEVAYFETKSLTKIKSAGSSQLNCEGIEASLGEQSTDIANTYNALAKVSTAERAQYLKDVTQYLVPTNRADTNLFARFLIAKIVRGSSAQVVKDAFAQAIEADQKELAKNNWTSIDQIEVNAYTLDFASRVLYAAIKLRMTMPDATDVLKPYLAELVSIASETKLSAKIVALHAFAEKIQPMVQELILDPRYQMLGMVTQDVLGWIVKN
jgi:hypothetical protein